MFSYEDPEYLYRRNHFCSELTNQEWERLLDKDYRGALDLSWRLGKRVELLEMGIKKRVPKHRYKKDPLEP